MLRKRLALVAGPLVALGLLPLELSADHPQVSRMAAVAILMAIWWIGEAVPLAITAMLPVVLLPAAGISSGKHVAAQYFNHVIFLFLGGFIVALAMQRWDLHRRIALRILKIAGVKPRRMLAGFMVASAFLSMWISNTAAAMMMVAIALAVVVELKKSVDTKQARRLSVVIFLGVAYGASIGGISTLVGTPPNLSFTRIYALLYPDAAEIGFASWFIFAFPLSATFLTLTWAYLSLWHCPRGVSLPPEHFEEQYARLGPSSFAEKVVLADFAALVLLWVTRAELQFGDLRIPGWSGWFEHPEYFDDGTVAIAVALILFMLPSRCPDSDTENKRSTRVMDWDACRELPWGVVLLFGGGFALASGFIDSGLSAWLGESLIGIKSVPPVVAVFLISGLLTFLTELTSNTATTEMMLPILAATATALSVDPLLFMVPATLSCSCAFMLPVATPPNAIVFGTGRVKMSEMIRTGLVLNFLGIFLIGGTVFLLGPPVLGIILPMSGP